MVKSHITQKSILMGFKMRLRWENQSTNQSALWEELPKARGVVICEGRQRWFENTFCSLLDTFWYSSSNHVLCNVWKACQIVYWKKTSGRIRTFLFLLSTKLDLAMSSENEPHFYFTLINFPTFQSSFILNILTCCIRLMFRKLVIFCKHLIW